MDDRTEDFIVEGEAQERLHLTPAQRLLETTKLWQLYLSLGGRLDPEPDKNLRYRVFYHLDCNKNNVRVVYDQY